MPAMTPEEIRANRKNAAQRLAVGSAMIGGATLAHQGVKDRTRVKGPIHLAREVKNTGVRPRHGKYAAGWLATRGAAAAGVPLAASGAANLLARRPKTNEGVNVRRDVVEGTVKRTVPLPKHQANTRQSKPSLKRRFETEGPLAIGGLGGAAAGTAVTRRLARNVKGKGRLAAIGFGTGIGGALGGASAVPITRHAVDVATSGTHGYNTRRGFYSKQPVNKAIPGAIVELPKTEQKQLISRKKKQSKYSLASAGLGLSAFGLKSPALVAAAAKRSKRLSSLKPVKSFAGHAPKADSYATNLGIASLGVGGMGSLNFARIQRAETKADQRATGIRKAHNVDLAKALVPAKLFRPKPVGFAGVRAGGIRRTPTGRLVPYRGSVG